MENKQNQRENYNNMKNKFIEDLNKKDKNLEMEKEKKKNLYINIIYYLLENQVQEQKQV